MDTDPTEPLKSTEGMVDYDKNSAAQQQLVKVHAGLIGDLTERVGFVSPEFKIVDYGCGPGTSAIDAVRPAIEAYQAHFPKGPISVCHADQPGNDWNSLFELVSGPSGYLDGVEGVRTEAAIGTFYDQMVAQDSVALGTCFVASQWLSHAVRLHSPGTVWFADLKGEARTEMEAIARRDWIRFLRCRAVELRRGGYLLVSTLGAVPDGSESNGAAVSGRGIYRALQIVVQGMADDGLIVQKVLDNYLFGLWFMTSNEAREPFDSEPLLKKNFEIEEISVVPAPVNPSDIFADSIADPFEYARRYAGYTRAFAASSLRSQLLEPSSTDKADADRLEQELFRRLEDLYRESPGRYACEVWYLTVVLRKF
jgi:hypothetical protein